MEHGVPLAQVRDLLGHASITTTERYDNQTVANLWIAAAKPERRQIRPSGGQSFKILSRSAAADAGIRGEAERVAGT